MLAGALGLVAMTALLTGCDKPKPTITVLSGNDSTTVPAQPTCTIDASAPCAPDPGKQRTISARSGGQILLDLAPELADNGYLVSAFTSDGTKNTPVTTPGASTGVTKSLTMKLAVPASAAGSYFLQVTALPPSKRFTTYLVRVNLTA